MLHKKMFAEPELRLIEMILPSLVPIETFNSIA